MTELVAQGSPTCNGNAPERRGKRGEEQKSPSERQVLIVDDVPNNLRVLSAALKEYGYRVRTVLSAKMAFSAIEAALPDLILLDINLPDLDGYSVCRCLKENPRTEGIPILFLSALGEAQHKVDAFLNGGVDYITKPFQLEEVIARVGLQFKLKELSADLNQRNLQLHRLTQHLKTQNDELVRAREAADRANQAKGEFLSHMSHELRTPLTAILGFNQLLMNDEDLKAKQRETMEIIHRSGKHLLCLINDVLDLAKIEAKRVEIAKTAFDLKDCLQDIYALFQLEANAKGLDFSITAPFDLPRFICADEKKLRQILINLLGNAFKFTPSGYIRLSIEQQVINETTLQLVFHVADSGMGIAESARASLFEPFRQTSTGQQSGKGTGLGLCVSRQLAQLMGGDIVLDTKLEPGSTFTLSLPAERVDQHHSDEFQTQSDLTGLLEQPSLASSEKVKAMCASLKMLVVDDHHENKVLLIQLLQSMGCQVEGADTGTEAIARHQQFQPNLIWLNLHLPDMHGMIVIEKIRSASSSSHASNMPHIVVTTASVFEQQQLAEVEQNCDGLIQKPFSMEQIGQTIARLFCSTGSSGGENAAGADVSLAQSGSLALAHSQGLDLSSNQQSSFLEQLKQMPEVWLKQLYNSSLDLDEDASQELLNQIPGTEQCLKNSLKELFRNLRYDLVLKSLVQIDPERYPFDSPV